VLLVRKALGAVGIAETQDSKGTPFSNGWVRLGVLVMSLAALWSVAVFVLAMISTAKTERFRIELGHALNDGEEIEASDLTMIEVVTWVQQAHDLIEGALGSAEGRLFLAEWDLNAVGVSTQTPEGRPYLNEG